MFISRFTYKPFTPRNVSKVNSIYNKQTNSNRSFFPLDIHNLFLSLCLSLLLTHTEKERLARVSMIPTIRLMSSGPEAVDVVNFGNKWGIMHVTDTKCQPVSHCRRDVTPVALAADAR